MASCSVFGTGSWASSARCSRRSAAIREIPWGMVLRGEGSGVVADAEACCRMMRSCVPCGRRLMERMTDEGRKSSEILGPPTSAARSANEVRGPGPHSPMRLSDKTSRAPLSVQCPARRGRDGGARSQDSAHDDALRSIQHANIHAQRGGERPETSAR